MHFDYFRLSHELDVGELFLAHWLGAALAEERSGRVCEILEFNRIV